MGCAACLSSLQAMQPVQKKKILNNFFSLGIVQVINALLQLLVIPPVIARIGMENYGVVAVAQVLMFYMATFTDYGYNQTATREVSLNRNNPQVLSVLFSRVSFAKILLCITAFVVLIVLSLFFPIIQRHFSLYCLAFLFVPGYAAQPVWILQGLEKMQFLALGTLAARIIFVGLVFIFIKGPGDSGLFLFFYGAGNLAAGIASTLYIMRSQNIQLRFPGWKNISSDLKAGWTITLTSLSMNVTQYGNLFILRLFTNDLVAGYFGVAERIFFTMKQGLTVFSQSVYPEVCRLAEQSLSGLKIFFQKVFWPFFILVCTGSALIFLFAPWLILFFAKEPVPDAVQVLRVLSVIIPVISLNVLPTVSLLAFDRRKAYAGIYISAMAVNIGLNSLLARYWQAKGTLAAIFITELFVAAAVWLAASRALKNNTGMRQPITLL
jgi:PST family polysaccharide transporter